MVTYERSPVIEVTGISTESGTESRLLYNESKETNTINLLIFTRVEINTFLEPYYRLN